MIIKCIVAYDGSNYCGWQIQPHSPSVQEEIEKALSVIHKKERVSIVGSGRTDTKVHALGQVFHFETEIEMAGLQWKRALNRMLPTDIRILDVCEEKADFHARFSAVSKRYDYYITRDVDNPFIQNYMAKDTRELDVERMRECAEILIGTHDFTSFTSNKIDERKSRIKTVTRIDVLEEGMNVHMIFEGDGFLRYQVRMMAQTLIEAGRHHLCKEDVEKMLKACDKHACRYKADPCGLYLVQVNYQGE